MYVCMYACMYVCMHVCMYVCIVLYCIVLYYSFITLGTSVAMNEHPPSVHAGLDEDIGRGNAAASGW